MAVLQLDSNLFYYAILQASNELISQRDTLNAINVFPVADGDTGNNMAATAQSILTHAALSPSLFDTCTSIANAAILGARGNSGMIFSQFFNGFLETSFEKSLSTVLFADVIATACTSVRAAIINPVEGTIVTVMEAWSQSISDNAVQQEDFLVLLQHSKKALQTALQSTTDTLDVLKAAQVVDAGALGFCCFIEGFINYIANPIPVEKIESAHVPYDHAHDFSQTDNPSLHRYCTEALIRNDAIDKEKLSTMLQEHGDSIVLTANKSLSRIHVHCDEPAEVFDELRQFGQIQYPKVDDMQRQFDILHRKKHSIALVTDSGADLPQSLLDTFAITLIPLNIHIDGHDLLDRYCIRQKNFYQSLKETTTYPTTSCPVTAMARDKLANLVTHYDAVIVISIAHALSGTYTGFVNIAKEFPTVHVIDSRNVSGGQALLVHYAAKLIHANNSVDFIKEALAKKIASIGFYVLVHQFDSLIRSGRVSKIMGKFAQFSGIKPIISMDEEGHATVCARVFQEAKALDKLVSLVKPLLNTNGLESYCIIHAGVPEKAAELAKVCTQVLQQPPLFIEYVSTAIGLHAGQGCIAIAAMPK